MKLKKKVILMANVMLCAAMFCACGKEVTEEEFKMRFDLAELLDSSSISRNRIKKYNGIATAFVINVLQKSHE